MERSPDDLLTERSLDDELLDEEYVRTHSTEIEEPPYEYITDDKPEPREDDSTPIAIKDTPLPLSPLTEMQKVAINRALGLPEDSPQPEPDDLPW